MLGISRNVVCPQGEPHMMGRLVDILHHIGSLVFQLVESGECILTVSFDGYSACVELSHVMPSWQGQRPPRVTMHSSCRCWLWALIDSLLQHTPALYLISQCLIRVEGHNLQQAFDEHRCAWPTGHPGEMNWHGSQCQILEKSVIRPVEPAWPIPGGLVRSQDP